MCNDACYCVLVWYRVHHDNTICWSKPARNNPTTNKSIRHTHDLHRTIEMCTASCKSSLPCKWKQNSCDSYPPPLAVRGPSPRCARSQPARGVHVVWRCVATPRREPAQPASLPKIYGRPLRTMLQILFTAACCIGGGLIKTAAAALVVLVSLFRCEVLFIVCCTRCIRRRLCVFWWSTYAIPLLV